MNSIEMFKYYAKSVAFMLLAVAFMIGSSRSAYADESPVAKADTLYSHGEYSKAAEAYEAVAKVDGDSPALLFNLANACAQTGDIGRAILYYSRAHRLDPTNKEIKNNLQYFSSKVEDSNRAELRGRKTSVAPDHETFFQSVRRIICAEFPVNMWAWIGVISFIIMLCQIAVYLFCSEVWWRKVGFFGGIASLFISVACVVFAFMTASYYESHDRAVLLAYKTELRIEPSSDAKPATNLLCQGTCFDVVAEETDVEGRPTWYKVRLNSDIEGWIRASEIEII